MSEITSKTPTQTAERASLLDVIQSGRILISDGAWGTFLHQKGLAPGECPELWNLSHPNLVREIGASYIAAGSDLIETNSFGGTHFKLEHYGLADRVAEINEAAARLSREAAGPSRWVIASVGPTGKMIMLGDVTEEELYEAFKTQIIALEKGGADAICIETMSDLAEAQAAIRAARDHSRLPVICTFTFDTIGPDEYFSMMGVSPAEAAVACVEAGAHIIGTNCGNGLRNMAGIIAQMRAAAPETPILVHANAGLPQLVDGETVYPESPAEMATLIPSILRSGAQIIGGCCGTTPLHIGAIRGAVDDYQG